MSDIFEQLYKGEYFDKEKKDYPRELSPESQTGFLQKRLEEIEKEFQKRSIAQDSEINFLRVQLEALKVRLDTHEKQHEIPEEVIEVRDIPMDKVKEEVLALMADGKTRYADDIAMKLKLDIKDVIEAFKQLQEEGKLFIDETKL